MSFEEKSQAYQVQFEKFLRTLFDKVPSYATLTLPGVSNLNQSKAYSLVEGGKRFRPILSMATAEAFGKPVERVLPFAVTIEMVHTFSLIHDDLPSMDNDDFRRGRPTNHKVFGESMALLAGDSLVVEALHFLSQHYLPTPLLRQRLMYYLTDSTQKMIYGQAIDLQAQQKTLLEDELRIMHLLKTGALMEAAILGAAEICEASEAQLYSLKEFAQFLGLAFQVADDLLDYDKNKPELCSYTSVLGFEETKKYLVKLTEQGIESLKEFDQKADFLRELLKWNSIRKK